MFEAMTRKRISPNKNFDDEQYVTIVTGGPMKYYNRRRVRKVFAKLEGVDPFAPITAEWFRLIIREIVPARHRKGISQMTLAGLLGTSQPEISRLELGKTNPTAETLDRLFSVLDLSIEVIIKPK